MCALRAQQHLGTLWPQAIAQVTAPQEPWTGTIGTGGLWWAKQQVPKTPGKAETGQEPQPCVPHCQVLLVGGGLSPVGGTGDTAWSA